METFPYEQRNNVVRNFKYYASSMCYKDTFSMQLYKATKALKLGLNATALRVIVNYMKFLTSRVDVVCLLIFYFHRYSTVFQLN